MHHILLRAKDELGEKVRNVGICILDRVVHTWGGCGWSSHEDGAVHRPGAKFETIAPGDLYTIEQCVTCAAQLSPGGGTSRWFASQARPYTATLQYEQQATSREKALLVCTPTDLLPIEAISVLLPRIGTEEPLGTGTVAVLKRQMLPERHADLLLRGAHHPDGTSLVNIPPQHPDTGPPYTRTVGEAPDDEHARAAAETFLALHPTWRGDPSGLWQTSLTLAGR